MPGERRAKPRRPKAHRSSGPVMVIPPRRRVVKAGRDDSSVGGLDHVDFIGKPPR